MLTVLISLLAIILVPWAAAVVFGKIITAVIDWDVEREFKRIDKELGR